MQTRRVRRVSFPWIHSRKPPGARIHPSCSVVLPSRVGVERLAGEDVGLGVRAGVGEEFAEGGVGVAVGDVAGFVAEPVARADAVGVDGSRWRFHASEC